MIDLDTARWAADHSAWGPKLPGWKLCRNCALSEAERRPGAKGASGARGGSYRCRQQVQTNIRTAGVQARVQQVRSAIGTSNAVAKQTERLAYGDNQFHLEIVGHHQLPRPGHARWDRGPHLFG